MLSSGSAEPFVQKLGYRQNLQKLLALIAPSLPLQMCNWKKEALFCFYVHSAIREGFLVWIFTLKNMLLLLQPPIRSRSTPWWASRDPTHSGLLLVKWELFKMRAPKKTKRKTRHAFLPTIGKKQTNKKLISTLRLMQELINPLLPFFCPIFSVSFWATTL